MVRSNNCTKGDVDVTQLNGCIQRLAEHWKNQQIEIASECHNLFFKDGQLSSRFYGQDGIHLTNSGVKRLLDAINRQFHVVTDFNTCVFGQIIPEGLEEEVSFRAVSKEGGVADTEGFAVMVVI